MLGTVLGAGTAAVDKTHGAPGALSVPWWEQTGPRTLAGDTGLHLYQQRHNL